MNTQKVDGKKPPEGGESEVGQPHITSKMMCAGLRWMVDLDGPYSNHGDTVEAVFSEMLSVVRATPELRVSYQRWLAEPAAQGSLAQKE